MTHRILPSRARGFASITTILIISIAFAFGVLLVEIILSRGAAGRFFQEQLSAQQLAEAGVHKAVFCLNATSGTNCGGTFGTLYAGESNVSLGDGKFTVSLTGGGSDREIVSVGTSKSGRTRTIKVTLTSVPASDNPQFSYALQAGEAGAHMENNATINGTLYANGNVDCQTTQAVVDGDIWVALDGGSIDACTVNYNAHADKVLNSAVAGDAYYENDPADIAGSTVGGTKYPGSATPSLEALPALDLQFWRDEAEAGGVIYGDHTPADNTTLGPVKITGNLLLSQNVDITITGPVWVMGNITTEQNSSLTLAAAFGEYSTVILADNPGNEATYGKITINNNTGINGSGNPKSHLMLASTNSSLSDVAPALSVANNAAGAVFLAINGTMRLQSGASAKSLAAKRLFIDQNAQISYVESELADVKFSNSPGGTWRILEGSWREAK